MGRAPALLHRPAAPWVHFPLFKERKSACEVITCGDDPPPGGLITFLCRLGFTPVVTRRLGRPVSERLIDAFVRGGGNLRSVQVELQHFGFDALPRVLLAARRRPSTHEDAATAVVAELLAEGLRALSEGAVRHPAQIDLLARLLFGFPLHRGSLFRMLDEPDAGALSDVVAARLGDHDAAEMLAERIGSGRGFHGALKRAA
jgi:hypothetical protein